MFPYLLQMFTGLRLSLFSVTAIVAAAGFLSIADGQPTIPEAGYWSREFLCGTEDIVSALDLLQLEVRSQRAENQNLRVDLTALADQNKQARHVLTQLVETLHLLVSRMAARYPCQCDM